MLGPIQSTETVSRRRLLALDRQSHARCRVLGSDSDRIAAAMQYPQGNDHHLSTRLYTAQSTLYVSITYSVATTN